MEKRAYCKESSIIASDCMILLYLRTLNLTVAILQKILLFCTHGTLDDACVLYAYRKITRFTLVLVASARDITIW